MPIVTVEDVDSVLAYYRDTLGFDVGMQMKMPPNGQLHTLIVQLGQDAALMFVAAVPGSPAPTALEPEGLSIYINVDDVDAYHDRIAGKAGVAVVDGLTDQFWGDRTFVIRDPWGLHLWLGQTTGAMSAPPEGMEVEMLQPVG
jgi:uncharacterized glyoxalase superfamily protein PhnB